MRTTQHIAYKKIVRAIAVDIGEVNAHCEVARGADGVRGDGAEAPFAVVDPDAVGSLKIVADINIGMPVGIDVAEHNRKALVPGRGCERLAFLIEEAPISPRRSLEGAFAVINVKGVGFAEFDHSAVNNFKALTVAATDDRPSIDRAHRNRSATAQDGILAVICDVEVEVAITIDVSQSDRMTTGFKGKTGGFGDVLK